MGDDRFRFDDKNGDGSWYCSHCGGTDFKGGGGNGFDLIMRVLKCDFSEAKKKVSEFLGYSNLTKKEVKKKEKYTILPIPDDEWKKIESLEFRVFNPKAKDKADKAGKKYDSSLLRPVMATEVKNIDGVRVGAVVRLEFDGKKITPQIVYTMEHGLTMTAMEAPRPLIGIHAVDFDKPVYVVEGEKCYHRMQNLGFNVLTSVGGAKSFLHSDWEKLTNSKVYILRDNDQEGLEYARGICGIIRAEIIDPPEGAPEKWDVADYIDDNSWGVDEINEWINSRIKKEVEPIKLNEIEQIPDYGWPHVKITTGKPKSTIDNFKYLFNHYGITCKYNLIKKDVEVFIPNLTTSFDNRANVTLAHATSLASQNDLPVSHIGEYIKAIADENQYNPIANFILSKPWDGVDRINDLMQTITTKKTQIRDLFVLRWLISCVSVNFDNNGAEGVLVLQGGQGLGKSRWLRRLLPPDMTMDYIAEGIKLDPESKDSVTTCVTNWLVELGELGSTFRKDLDMVKSFIANKVDRLRRPYDRLESAYPRRTVFYASVNESEFLKDITGSRRWFVIPVDAVNYTHNIDVQQLWAQVYVLYKKGERGWINAEEIKMLEASNEEHNEEEPSISKMKSLLDWESSQLNWRWATTTEIAEELGYTNPSRSVSTYLGRELDRLGCERRRTAGRNLRLVPCKKGGSGEQIPDWL